MPRKSCLEGVSERRRTKRLATKQTAGQRQLIGYYSQDATSIISESTRNGQTSYPSEEKQMCLDFLKNVTTMSVPVIKKEIIDPSEQNQELFLPEYPQHRTSNLMSVLQTEILDSSKTNQKLLLTNIKVEPTQIDNVIDEPSRTEAPSESGNSLALKYKLTKCSVLLHDCLIPENLASISSNFKSLKINKDISDAYPNSHLYPFTESPFFSHISETYKNIVISKKEEKPKPCKVGRFNDIKKKKIPSKRINTKKKYICNCYNTITVGSQLDGNNFELAQQLCSCVMSDFMLSENRKPEEISLFDPDFGKITCSINKIF